MLVWLHMIQLNLKIIQHYKTFIMAVNKSDSASIRILSSSKEVISPTIHGVSDVQEEKKSCSDSDDVYIDVDEDSTYPDDAWKRLKASVPDLKKISPEMLLCDRERSHFLR